MGSVLAAAGGSVHLPGDHAALVRPQPALHSRPSSRRRASSPTFAGSPTPSEAVVADTNLHPFHFAGRAGRPGAQRAPAAVRAHALRARRARAAGAGGAHRGHDRLRVDLRADPVAARRSLRTAGDPRARRGHRQRRCASCGQVRAAHGIDTSSPVNLCVSTGRAVVATRFSFDYGWYPPEDEMLETDLPFVSLWYAIGGEYVAARRRLADDSGRSAPLGDHRLGAADDRPVDAGSRCRSTRC